MVRRVRSGSGGLLLALLIAGAPADAEAQELEIDLDGIGYVLGDTMASIQVVEFGDFACSACAEFWHDTWPSIRSDLIETGRVGWRHVPFLLGFARGDDAANAAECAADQGQFWAMHDLLFAGQEEWTRTRRPEEAFGRYAQQIGLDSAEFTDCYDEERGEDRTRAATRAARRASVRGTPTFFINGRPAYGALPLEMFVGLVEDEERRAAGPRPGAGL